jgi:hypothetical protein
MRREELSIVASWHLIEKRVLSHEKQGRKIEFAEEKIKMK